MRLKVIVALKGLFLKVKLMLKSKFKVNIFRVWRLVLNVGLTY